MVIKSSNSKQQNKIAEIVQGDIRGFIEQINEAISEIKAEFNKADVLYYYLPFTIRLPKEFLATDKCILTDFSGVCKTTATIYVRRPLMHHVIVREDSSKVQWLFRAQIENIVDRLVCEHLIVRREKFKRDWVFDDDLSYYDDNHEEIECYVKLDRHFLLTIEILAEVPDCEKYYPEIELSESIKRLQKLYKLQKLEETGELYKRQINEIRNYISNSISRYRYLVEHTRLHFAHIQQRLWDDETTKIVKCGCCCSRDVDDCGYDTLRYRIEVPFRVYNSGTDELVETGLFKLWISVEPNNVAIFWRFEGGTVIVDVVFDKFHMIKSITEFVLTELGVSWEIIAELPEMIYKLGEWWMDRPEPEDVNIYFSDPELIPVHQHYIVIPVPRNVRVCTFNDLVKQDAEQVVKLCSTGTEAYRRFEKCVTNIGELNLSIIDTRRCGRIYRFHPYAHSDKITVTFTRHIPRIDS